MKLGVVFPQTEIGADPAAVRSYAQAVQDAGFDHLVIYDHVLGADRTAHPGFDGAYDVDDMFHEPLVLFGYLAGVAPGLELATSVLVAPQRQTALLAKQAVELDLLTEGRFRLGIGWGWNPVEYEALGMTFADRHRRVEEQVELLRLLWRDRVVTYDGEWHHVHGAGLNPRPAREIPIWLGANRDPGLKRGARIAEGLFLHPFHQPLVPQIREWVEGFGRDPGQFGLEGRVDVAQGTPADWVSALDAWRELDVSHVAVSTMRRDAPLGSVEHHVDRIHAAGEALRA